MIETTEDLIPHCWLDAGLYSRLEGLGIYTCLELFEYPENTFLKQKGMGLASLKVIRELKAHIRRYLKLDRIHAIDVWSLDSTIPKEQIPSFLRNKLAVLNVNTFQELDSLDIDNLNNMKGLGTKAISEMKSFQEQMRIFISERVGMPLSSNTESKNIRAVTLDEFVNNSDFYWNDFQKNVLNENEQAVIRYAIAQDNPKKLRDIGDYLDLSRERVRQIRDGLMDNVERYFFGGHFEQLDWYLSDEVVSQFLNALVLFREKAIIPLDIFQKSSQCLNSLPKNQLLAFIFTQSLIIAELSNEMSVVCSISSKDLSAIEFAIYRHLKESKGLSNLFDITVFIKRQFIGISNVFIKNILPLIKGITVIDDTITLDHGMLYRYNDIAAKVLEYEGKPLHFSEIKRRVDEAMVAVGRTPHVDKASAGTLSNDPRFTCIGKTGQWGLTDWNLKPKTAQQTLMDVLAIHKEPMEKKMLIANAVKQNTTYTIQTFYAVLYFALDKKEILLTSDGRVVHSEYSSKFDIQPYEKVKRERHLLNFNYWLYEETNQTPLSMDELWAIYPLSGSTSHIGFKLKVYNCELLERIGKDSHSMKYCMRQRPENTKPLSKFEQLENDIFDILDENNGLIKLVDAVKILNRNGYAPQSTYGVVDKSPYFETIICEDEKKQKYLAYSKALL